MSYFTHPVAQNPQVKHPTGIPWMKTPNRNTQSEIIQGVLRVLPQNLSSHCATVTQAFPYICSSISFCDPTEFKMEPTAATE